MKKTLILGMALIAVGTAQAAYTTNNFTQAAALQSNSGWKDGSASIALKDAAETGTGLRQGLLRLNLTGISDAVTDASIKINAKKQVSYTLYLWGVVDGAPGQDWNDTTTDLEDVAASGMYAPIENLESAGDPNLVLLGSQMIVGTGVSQYDDYIFSTPALTDWLNSDADGDATVVVTIGENVNTAMRSITTGDTAPVLAYSIDPADAPDPVKVFQIGGDSSERDTGWTAATTNASGTTATYTHVDESDSSLVFTLTASVTNAQDQLYLSAGFIGVDSSARGLDDGTENGQIRRLSPGEEVVLTLSVSDPNNALATFGMSGVGPQWGNGTTETTTVTDASSTSFDFVAIPNTALIQGNWSSLGLEDISVANAASWAITWTAQPGAQTGAGGFAFTYTLGDGSIPNPWGDWLDLYPTLGTSTNYADDFDLDGMDNLLEFALGGNPTNDDAVIYMPISTLDEEGGTSYLNYVYRRSVDATAQGLTYDVVSGTDLVFNNVTNATEEAGVSGDLGDGFASVTNRVLVDTEIKQFMQLNVQKN